MGRHSPPHMQKTSPLINAAGAATVRWSLSQPRISLCQHGWSAMQLSVSVLERKIGDGRHVDPRTARMLEPQQDSTEVTHPAHQRLACLITGLFITSQPFSALRTRQISRFHSAAAGLQAYSLDQLPSEGGAVVAGDSREPGTSE